MSFTTCMIIAAGGALGTVARYVLSILALPVSRSLPWGTILINVAGCAILGFVGTFTLAQGRHALSENARLFLMVGFCGGFTTFSAFSLQTFDLLRSGAMARALINIAVSVIVCVGAVALGHLIAAQFNDRAIEVAQIDIEGEA